MNISSVDRMDDEEFGLLNPKKPTKRVTTARILGILRAVGDEERIDRTDREDVRTYLKSMKK